MEPLWALNIYYITTWTLWVLEEPSPRRAGRPLGAWSVEDVAQWAQEAMFCLQGLGVIGIGFRVQGSCNEASVLGGWMRLLLGSLIETAQENDTLEALATAHILQAQL